MQRFRRLFCVLMMMVAPALARADEACDALGHLLLASDLMRIAADSGGNLEDTYGPSIGASLRSAGELPRELRQRAPEKFSALETLREIAATALAFASAGRIEVSSLDETGRTVAQDARQLYVDWTCDDPENGPGSGDLTGGEEGERDPSNGGVGSGGAVGFRAVWSALGNENRVERAVLLGCFATSIILLPYLIMRDRRKRRRSERHLCTSPTVVTVEDDEIDARFFDISVTGARLTLRELLPPGSPILVEVVGETVAATVIRSGTGFAGIQFDTPLSDAQLAAQLEDAKLAMSWATKVKKDAPPVAKTG